MEPYNKYWTRALKLTRQFISINMSPSLADFIFECRRVCCCVRLGHLLTWTAFYKCWHLAMKILSAHTDMPARWRRIHFILPPKTYFDLAVGSNLSRHSPVWEMKSIQAQQINMVLLPQDLRRNKSSDNSQSGFQIPSTPQDVNQTKTSNPH